MSNVDKVVTNVDLIREDGVAVTETAFTSDVSTNDTETLIIIPTKPGNRMIVIIREVSGAGPLVVTIKAGNYWAALAMDSVEVASSTSVAIMFQAAFHKDKDDNTIEIKVAPETGEKLVTTSAATWMCFQIPD